MKPGARSIRGAMGTYAVVAVIALALIALLLRFGPSLKPARAELTLPGDAGWSGAVLSGPDDTLELAPGETLRLPAGAWSLRLFTDDGRVVDRALQLHPDEQHTLPPSR
ncbi:MAG: hypothetical protein DHS20C15_06270 [Planctomycetota bacterium]|nr:MAG: hypothetical protein DHS20C15_06270 [Planctomycetota bacterium]